MNLVRSVPKFTFRLLKRVKCFWSKYSWFSTKYTRPYCQEIDFPSFHQSVSRLIGPPKINACDLCYWVFGICLEAFVENSSIILRQVSFLLSLYAYRNVYSSHAAIPFLAWAHCMWMASSCVITSSGFYKLQPQVVSILIKIQLCNSSIFR